VFCLSSNSSHNAHGSEQRNTTLSKIHHWLGRLVKWLAAPTKMGCAGRCHKKKIKKATENKNKQRNNKNTIKMTIQNGTNKRTNLSGSSTRIQTTKDTTEKNDKWYEGQPPLVRRHKKAKPIRRLAQRSVPSGRLCATPPPPPSPALRRCLLRTIRPCSSHPPPTPLAA